MPSNSASRLRNLSRVLRGERAITAASRRALQALLTEAARALAAAGYDTSVLDDRFPGWRAAIDKDVVPTIEAVFLEAWDATSRAGTIDPTKYATRYLEAVHNRLVGVSDDVFDTMRMVLEEGRQAQESIPQLAARVDALLSDEQRWTNRAVTIARTETIGANNAGSYDSAFATADLLGVPHAQVARVWLSTIDSRTRESHAAANGQARFGTDPYEVGGALLSRPGDPSGPADEVINCRCSELFYMPGDPQYPSGASTSTYTAPPLVSVPDVQATLTPAPVSSVPVVEEQATDPGPQSDMERMARALTLSELQMETRRGSADAKRVAKAELRRRGITASADPVAQTDDEMTAEVVALMTARFAAAEEAPVTEPTTERQYVDIRVEGPPDQIDQFIGLAQTIEYLGSVGASRTIQVDADGDGALSLRFDFGETTVGEVPVSEDDLDGGELFIGLAAAALAPEESEGPASPPTHAGIAVQATDTGRILMQQRAYDPEDAPDVRGTWEFPGGGLEDGETPEAGAWREWVEETGLSIPEHTITGGWLSPDGVYQCFVATISTESAVGLLNPDDAAVLANPDDPERENPDVTAWFTAEQVQDMGAAVRPEVLASTDWSQFQPTPAEEAPMDTEPNPDLEAALRLVRNAGYHLALDAAVGDVELPQPTPPEEPPVEPEAPADEAPAEPDGEPFYGIIWPEGVESGDRRAVEVGGTTWRDLPLPLMAQDAQAPGHDGAIRTGRIDTLERDETTYSVPVIRYTGVWDDSAEGVEVARQVEKRIVRGISTDGDAVTVELRASTGETLDPMVDEFPDDGVIVEVATAARISGGTVCSIPAFHQAYIANGRLEDRTEPEPGWNEDGTPKDNVLVTPAEAAGVEEAMVASAWSLTAAAPIQQPAEAFTRPDVLDDNEEGTPLTVTDDGRVYGHLAVWGTCHIGIDGLCQEPPASATNYAYFATGSVQTDDGNYMPTGPLVMDTGHAALTLGHRPAAAHYDNTGAAVADIVMGQDHIGIWYSGVLRPGITPERVYALRAAGKVSGDWRNIGGNLELVAALVVNTPGFSIPRPALAASAGQAQAMVAAGMVRTAHPAEAPSEAERIAALVVATLDRRERARVAASRVNTRLASARQVRVAAAAARIRERV